jgi:hypothetical protein
MRSKRAIKGISKIIGKYGQKVQISSSFLKLNRKNGKYVKKVTEKVVIIAIFKIKYKHLILRDSIDRTANIKIYSCFKLNIEEEIKTEDAVYRIISVEKRTESSPIVYIAFAEEIINNE